MPGMVPVGEAEVSGRQYVGVQDMREILSRMLGQRIWDEVPVSDLVHCEVVEHDRRGRPVGLEPLYELRFRRFGASQAGIVGHMTHGMFMDWVDYSLNAILEQLRKEQPGCEWVLVGALVDQVNLRRATAVPFRGARSAEASILRDLAGHDPEDKTTQYAINRQTDYQQLPDLRWEVRTVWTDKAQGELVDPQVALGAHPGPMSKYIEDRQLRHLTQGAREIRRKCEDALREYEARMLLAEKLEDEQRTQPARGVPVAKAAPEISEAQVRAAFEMRAAGVNLHQVAAAMGVPYGSLERMVEEHVEEEAARAGVSDHERLAEHVALTG